MKNAFKNIFCCLVHEQPEVVWDLVANLRTLDPASDVLLYNSSGDSALLADPRLRDDPHVHIHPEPRPQRYGALHGFMLDCMAWACERDFDTLTNVDSDQLLLRPGYSERLAEVVAQHPNLGMVCSPPASPGWPGMDRGLLPGRRFMVHPQRTALSEFAAWRPFLARHGDALRRFPQWSFWPGAVFHARACRGILTLWDKSALLRALIARTKIFAAEEVLLPMLVDALGLDLVKTPFDETCLRFKAQFNLNDLEESLAASDRFWMHPVPREINQPIRAVLRQHHGLAPETPAVRVEGAIPKIMHHIWIGDAPIPAQMQEWRDGWRRLHPDWTLHLWTDANLPPMQNQALYDSRANTGHRSDILRYEILRRFGGVYVDFDFECQKPLDALIASCQGFIGKMLPVQVDTCTQYMEIALLGSIPDHPLYAQIVDTLPTWHDAHAQMQVPVRTGPQFFQAQYERWRASGGVYEGRTAEFTLFDRTLFYPYSWTERERGYDAFPDAYAIHRWWVTWQYQPDEEKNKEKSAAPRNVSAPPALLSSEDVPPLVPPELGARGPSGQGGLYELSRRKTSD